MTVRLSVWLFVCDGGSGVNDNNNNNDINDHTNNPHHFLKQQRQQSPLNVNTTKGLARVGHGGNVQRGGASSALCVQQPGGGQPRMPRL